MSALKQRILSLIEVGGPIGVADYMALCLFDPEHGYYTTREPFGTAGDFTTAPEISQMFGELVAIWLHSAWQAIGAPAEVALAEIGPGRGTLMKDMVRTLKRINSGFAAQADLYLIETSPRLAARQKETLAENAADIRWCRSVSELPETPLLIVGNELFDAVPIRQYVKTERGWHERVVAIDDGELVFRAGPSHVDAALLPTGASAAKSGSIFEFAPARTALMEGIAAAIAENTGAGLFVDYGHAASGIGETLQAVRKHAYDDVLAHPGEADLTAHVDFQSLAAAAGSAGLDAKLLEQGEFLLAMGLLERAGALGANRDAGEQARIRAQVERLAGPEAMGRLFKVLAVLPSGVAVAPFGVAH